MKAVLLAALALAAATLAVTPAQAMAEPIQCVMAPCGPQCFAPCVPTDRLPDLPGLPTFPVCVTDPCAYVVCDHAQDQVADWHYEFTSSCGLILTKTSPACPSGPYVQDAAVGNLVIRHAWCATVDVESTWTCAPPSGSVVERDVLFVHASILVCHPDIPPIVTT